MFRSLFSIASIFALLLPIFMSSAEAAERRCPIEPPRTLLYLYRNSDSIHIGNYDRLEAGTITEDTEDYTAIDIKKHFSISSTLKGENRKFFAIEDKEYRYKNQGTSDLTEEESEMDEAYAPSLEPGDAVILFLKKGEGEDAAPSLTHYRDSIKKVTKDELESYEKALRGLNSIFGAKRVSDEAIVQWLVDLAGDPNTRWEGAFELLQSFQQAEWKKQQDERQAELRKNGEAVAEEGASEESADEPDTAVYSKLLTDSQKSELMNIVLESRPDAKITSRQARGDGTLIDLVSNWGDSRFAAFLVERLRSSTADNHYERYDLMTKIAEILKDDDLSSISAKFSDVTYQEDDAVVGEAEQNEEEQAEEAQAESTDGGTSEAGTPENPVPAKVTYKELRGELITKFLSRSDTLLAKANDRETAKLSNN